MRRWYLIVGRGEYPSSTDSIAREVARVSSPYDALRALLSDRPIAFHPALARLLGGINEALLFQQLAYWSDKGDDPEWIYKSQVELEAETTLSEYQQLQARKKLKALGVIEDERRGVPARLYYRVDWEAVFRLLETGIPAGPSFRETQNLDSGDARFRETENLDSEKPRGKSRGNSASLTSTEKTQRARQRDLSNGPDPARLIPSRDRAVLERYAEDYAAELRDQAPLSATVSRLTNLYAESGLPLDPFLDLLQDARVATQKRSGGIRAETGDGSGRKAKMAYFFGVLEDLIEKRGA
jgi:hypothetical protein